MNSDDRIVASDGWRQALEQFSAVTDLSVVLYAADGRRVDGPVTSTPLYDLFWRQGREAAAFEADARAASLAPREAPRVMVCEHDGLATLAVRIGHEGDAMVAVAGIALTSHLDEERIAALARAHGLPFETVWTVVHGTTPLSRQRLTLCGELLATLAETLVRERARARELEITSAQLAETMRVKDEFLAVVSHELRTPLTPILSWTQILKRRPHAASVSHVMDVIERNVRRQIELVNELLDLNRVERGELKVELRLRDLREIARAAVDTVAALAEHRQLTITWREPGHPVLVDADPPRLSQVFGNLLSNAIKFTPAGGRITVDVMQRGAQAVVAVRDTGAGIRADFLPYVFDMFRQQDAGDGRPQSGLGIGLALARRLIELHGGTIRAASEGAGRGTEMTVSLPVRARGPAPLESAPGDDVTRLPHFDGLSVLVVDDTDDLRAAACVMLEDLGARATGAVDGRDALRQLQTSVPDVVLCNLRMPGMDGFELLRQLRGAGFGGALPVIACSALVGIDDERRVREAGFAGYLQKPFGYESLAGALGVVWRRAAAA